MLMLPYLFLFQIPAAGPQLAKKVASKIKMERLETWSK